MSKSEILYVKGMNLSESEDDADEDVWDDKKLNDAYDKALRIANAEVAKRVAMSTNSPHKNKQDESKNRKEKNMNKGTSKNKKKESGSQWKESMPCRAIYEEDGLEYEAMVMKILDDKECLVQFIGYNNTEIVPINTLKPSLGKKERERQIIEAIEDKSDEAYTSQSPNLEKMDCYSNRAPSPQSTGFSERSFYKNKRSGKKKKNPSMQVPNRFQIPEMPFAMPNMASLRNLGAMDMPLPPPPPLPLLNGNTDSEEQAISHMLLSWYMSGYYTGLYQGLKRAKENRRNM